MEMLLVWSTTFVYPMSLATDSAVGMSMSRKQIVLFRFPIAIEAFSTLLSLSAKSASV